MLLALAVCWVARGFGLSLPFWPTFGAIGLAWTLLGWLRWKRT